MKLSKKALKEINVQQIRLRLALELKVSEVWIIKSIQKNHENGLLTKAAAIEVIKANTKLKEVEILETGKKIIA
ncbi:MAG: hypothetical protein H0X41_11460 [Chitinophagaceae bacterium]|nr:hypothetical protein [Chitinophagaceae bacterium]